MPSGGLASRLLTAFSERLPALRPAGGMAGAMQDTQDSDGTGVVAQGESHGVPLESFEAGAANVGVNLAESQRMGFDPGDRFKHVLPKISTQAWNRPVMVADPRHKIVRKGGMKLTITEVEREPGVSILVGKAG